MEEQKAINLLEAGKILYSKGAFRAALPRYMDALNLFRKMGSPENEAETLLELGRVHLKLGYTEGSSKYYRSALTIYTELTDHEGQGRSMNGIALASEKLGEHEASRSQYTKALKMFRRAENQEMEAEVLTNIARTYESQGAWEDALMDYQSAETIFKKIKNDPGRDKTREHIRDMEKRRSISLRNTVLMRKVLVLLVYLAALILAGYVTVYQSAEMGFVIYIGTVFALLFHSSLVREQNFSYLLMSMMALPIIGIGIGIVNIVLSMHILKMSLLFWFPILAVTLFGASYAIMRVEGLGLRHVGFLWGDPKLQILVALTGFLLGPAEYLILTPSPMVSQFSLEWVLFAGLIFIVSTGLAEELLFRGIIQKNVENVFGTIFGLIYTSLIFAAMHVVWTSPLDMVFVFAVSMFYGYVFHKTRSIVGVTFSHGILNTFLFLIMPFLMG